jgi:XTP/dITP diphosphohydrolase
MTTLLIATRNQHKLQEIGQILGADFECRSLREYPSAPEVTENASSFAGNAAKKAVELSRWLARFGDSGLCGPMSEFFVIADDSGLEVDALGGAPGVYSARFAALDNAGSGNASDTANNAKLLRLLHTVPWEQRTARFRCVIALALTPVSKTASNETALVFAGEKLEYQSELFEGVCEGRLGFELRGQNGFGYDPLFIPDGYDRSFAELGDAVKGQISHRAKALAGLKAWFERRWD